jgi:hypothetical protein
MSYNRMLVGQRVYYIALFYDRFRRPKNMAQS